MKNVSGIDKKNHSHKKIILKKKMALLKLDMTRYLELLEKEKELKSQGKNLNQNENLEKLNYQIILQHHIDFCQREKYLKLVKEFLDQQFKTAYFNFKFTPLWDGTRSQIDELEQTIFQEKQATFITDSRAKKFSGAVSGIFWAFEALTDEALQYSDPDEEIKEEVFEEMKEQEFLHDIQEVWKEMQEILKEE